MSCDEAWHIIERAGERGMVAKERRVPELMGVDEKAVAKGQTYMTLVCDLERSTVEYIATERKQASLDGFFDGLREEERTRIRRLPWTCGSPT